MVAAALYPQRRLVLASIGELLGPRRCFAQPGTSTLPKPGRVITSSDIVNSVHRGPRAMGALSYSGRHVAFSVPVRW